MLGSTEKTHRVAFTLLIYLKKNCFLNGFKLKSTSVPFCRDADETKPTKEKHEGKEKSAGSRRGGRYHPYKDKHGGEKKPAHRNRVFISNIPYDMKWQAIKDLMREKGNVMRDWGNLFFYVFLLSLLEVLDLVYVVTNWSIILLSVDISL